MTPYSTYHIHASERKKAIDSPRPTTRRTSSFCASASCLRRRFWRALASAERRSPSRLPAAPQLISPKHPTYKPNKQLNKQANKQTSKQARGAHVPHYRSLDGRRPSLVVAIVAVVRSRPRPCWRRGHPRATVRPPDKMSEAT